LTGSAQPLYLVAMIAAVIGWSVGTLWQKRSVQQDGVLGFTAAQMLFGGIFQFVLSVLDAEWQAFDVAAVSLPSWLALLYLIVFGSIIGLNSYLWLLTRVPAAKVTTYALVNPVVALILGALVLDEEITTLIVVSTLLVLFGVSLVLFQNLGPATFARVAKSLSTGRSP
jgi:drug/metabolite transporter (DMT)-like permease